MTENNRRNFLHVPFGENDLVKALGAKWDISTRHWYVPQGLDAQPFARWCGESGLHESDFGIYAAGTFRIAGEADESKQPMFNFATVNCEKPSGEVDEVRLECKVTKVVVWAQSGKPDINEPNCSLDLDSSAFSMKELQKGVLIGLDTAASTSCFNTILTIDRNTKRVYTSFTRTKYADNYDKIKPGTCGTPPRDRPLRTLPET